MSEEEVWVYYPKGVQGIIGFGTSSFVGDLGNGQVLKYPRIARENGQDIEHEARIYAILGRHPRILTFLGLDSRGLRLEKALNGTVYDFLRIHSTNSANKLKWSRQLAEAVAYVHSKKIIHNDISIRNCFLDENLDLMLGDFQGLYTDNDGRAREAYAYGQLKSSVPGLVWRSHQRSDLFAIGTAMYEMMTGHEPYPELDSIEDEARIEELYASGQFPELHEIVGQDVIWKCWSQLYETAEECAQELKDIEEAIELSPYNSDTLSI